jgi:hypothetical protein
MNSNSRYGHRGKAGGQKEGAGLENFRTGGERRLRSVALVGEGNRKLRLAVLAFEITVVDRMGYYGSSLTPVGKGKAVLYPVEIPHP